MFFFYCEQERVLQVCTYSGSSSDTETEPEGTGSTLGPRTLINRAKKSDSGLAEHFITKWFWYLSFCPFPPPLIFYLTNSSVHSRPEWGDPEEKQCGEIFVNHGLLPTRCVLTSGEGQQEDFPVQLVAQGVIPWWQSRRQTQCEY